jgi:FixJ family two-component response regulator
MHPESVPTRKATAKPQADPAADWEGAMADTVVYVVDDDDSFRRALARLLRSASFKVETFPSARAFLERHESATVSCLVLDVKMPGLSGLELQATMGAQQERTPIIFLTGRGNVPTSVRAMKDGAVDFFGKPVDEDDLLDAVKRALVRSRETLARETECAEAKTRLAALTPREREVLALVLTGMLNKQIAGELGAAEKTVKIHRGRVMKKMQVQSVAELVRLTQKAGVGPASPPRCTLARAVAGSRTQ